MTEFRAIIVGIDHYDAKPFRDLTGPVRDAVRFAKWLLDVNVDPQAIQLFLAPIPKDLPADLTAALAKLQVRHATKQEIRGALTQQLKAAPPRRLCLFWGGHGMVKEDTERRLFYADVSDDEFPAFDVKDFLASLNTDRFVDPAVLQQTVVIVDACANYAEMKGVAQLITKEEFPRGNTKIQRDQFTLFSASLGEYAKEDKPQQTGIFSSALLNALNSRKSLQELFELESIARALEVQFSEWRKDGVTRQRPDFFRWRRWKSSEEQGGGSVSLADTDAERRVTAADISLVEMSELMKLVSLIDPPVPEEAASRELARVMFWLEPTVPASTGAEWFRRCIEILAPRAPANLLKFLELCRPHFPAGDPANKIDAWETALAQRAKVDLAACRAEARNLAAAAPAKGIGRRVQILVEAVPGEKRQQKIYRLHVCVPSEKPGSAPLLFKSAARPYTGDAGLRDRDPNSYAPSLSEDFDALFTAALEKVDQKTPELIETFLPNELLDCGAEAWDVPYGVLPRPVGTCFPVALRSFQRHYDRNYGPTHAVYRAKWNGLAALQTSHISWVEDPPQVNPLLFREWNKSGVLALCALTLEAANPGVSPGVFDYMVSAGIAAAIWLRGHKGALPPARQELQNSFVARASGEWLRVACDWRGAYPPKLPCDGLAVLWDDPNAPVPDHPQLQAPK